MLKFLLISMFVFSPHSSDAAASKVPCLPLTAVIPDSSFETWFKDHYAAAQARTEKKFAATDTKKAGATFAAEKDPLNEYQMVWGRDNAISKKSVPMQRRDIAKDYIDFTKSNLATKTLEGPGEPRFFPDGRTYNGPWGRPQRDTSAYRAHGWLDEMTYQIRNKNVSQAKSLYITDFTQPSVKMDLEYMAHNWSKKGFELWEEEEGIHTHTLQVTHAALERSLTLVRRFEDPRYTEAVVATYQGAIDDINSYLQANAWDAEHGYIRSTIVHTGGFVHKQNPLDIGTIIGVNHAEMFNPGGNAVFKHSDERVMATMAEIEKSMDGLYNVNDRFKGPEFKGAKALGRYAEDIFHGGNPWTISTQAAAEYYSRLGTQLMGSDGIRVTAVNQKFFARLTDGRVNGLRAGSKILPTDPRFMQIITAVREKGVGYLKVIQAVTPEGGIASEQIGRGYKPGDTWNWLKSYLEANKTVKDPKTVVAGGQPVGAFNLTWNDASFNSAADALVEFDAAIKAFVSKNSAAPAVVGASGP